MLKLKSLIETVNDIGQHNSVDQIQLFV